MSRIATLTAVLTMAVAPAAFAGPSDLRSPDVRDVATPAKIDLRSPDAANPFTQQVAHVDLRTPDAVHGFVAPAASPQPSADDGNGVSTWALIAIIAAAFGASGLLVVMLRRHLEAGGPLGA
jgi:hypothetical protein